MSNKNVQHIDSVSLSVWETHPDLNKFNVSTHTKNRQVSDQQTTKKNQNPPPPKKKTLNEMAKKADLDLNKFKA